MILVTLLQCLMYQLHISQDELLKPRRPGFSFTDKESRGLHKADVGSIASKVDGTISARNVADEDSLERYGVHIQTREKVYTNFLAQFEMPTAGDDSEFEVTAATAGIRNELSQKQTSQMNQAKFSGEKDPVYDFATDGAHRYVAQGASEPMYSASKLEWDDTEYASLTDTTKSNKDPYALAGSADLSRPEMSPTNTMEDGMILNPFEQQYFAHTRSSPTGSVPPPVSNSDGKSGYPLAPVDTTAALSPDPVLEDENRAGTPYDEMFAAAEASLVAPGIDATSLFRTEPEEGGSSLVQPLPSETVVIPASPASAGLSPENSADLMSPDYCDVTGDTFNFDVAADEYMTADKLRPGDPPKRPALGVYASVIASEATLQRRQKLAEQGLTTVEPGAVELNRCKSGRSSGVVEWQDGAMVALGVTGAELERQISDLGERASCTSDSMSDDGEDE